MAENNHTPGPWYPHFLGPAPSVLCDSGCPIVGWPGFDDSDRRMAEHQANARLIAASPDLFDVLKSVEWQGDRSLMEMSCPCCGGGNPDLPSTPEDRRGHERGCSLAAALNKAEGKD